MSAATGRLEPNATSATRQLWNKVPEITIFFWIIKVLCTTVGETCSDFLSEPHGWGIPLTALITGVLLAVVLFMQFRSKAYKAGWYWLAVVLISVFGTLITDYLHDDRGVALVTTTTIFAIALAATFILWFAVEHTLSIHTIFTTRREAFYWLAILFTFALGTAAGDLLAEKCDLGYLVAVLIFAGAIALVTIAYYGVKLNAVFAFWAAYVMTRPLGGSLGDYLSSDRSDGGLGLGTTVTSALFLTAILGAVVYLIFTKRDVRREPFIVMAKSDEGGGNLEGATPEKIVPTAEIGEVIE